MSKPRIMIGNDSRHALTYRFEYPVQVEEYQTAVDELLGTPIDILSFQLGYGNGFLHGTNVADRWGPTTKATEGFRPGGGTQWTHGVFQRAYKNAKQLIEEGNDPLAIICNRGKEKGLLVYPLLQVQASSFDKSLQIGTNGNLPTDFPGDGADFKHQQVQDARFAIVEEVINNYNIDGFELNLNHYVGDHFFHPDEIESGKKIMTSWISRIYQTLKNSDSNRELAIRVPADIEKCYSIGLDIEDWIDQGIVDIITGETFALRAISDPTINFRPLVEAAKGSKTRIFASIQNGVDSDRLHLAPIEIMRATACNYWAQGIDGLHLPTWFGEWPYDAFFYEKIREIADPEIMAPRDKYYRIPSHGVKQDDSGTDSHDSPLQLPADLNLDVPTSISIPISDDLNRWGDMGHIHEVLLRIKVMRATEHDKISFNLNGKELPSDLLRTIDNTYMMQSPRYRSHPGYWYIFKLDRSHWPQNGDNNLDITLNYRYPEVTPEIYVRDVEMEIKYLRGKGAHRGAHNTDPDLGSYVHSW